MTDAVLLTVRREAFDVFHKSIETLAKEHKILSGKWLYLQSNGTSSPLLKDL
jgi:hypothetical protein